MMKLDVAVQAFDMQDISNRRFMYNPKTGILVLGQHVRENKRVARQPCRDLAQAGIRSGFDDFVRGWVGTGKSYPAGVIILPRMWTSKMFPCSIGRLIP